MGEPTRSDRRSRTAETGVFTQAGLPGVLRTVSPAIPLVCWVCGHTEDRRLPIGAAIQWRLDHIAECRGGRPDGGA